MSERFRKLAAKIASGMGSPWAFVLALVFVAAWAAMGPVLHYSEDWQLFVNTGTTIATFLMLFIVQNSQNRDTKAINLKLDELLRAIEGARTGLAAIGDMTDDELDQLEGEFRSLAKDAKVVADAAQQIESLQETAQSAVAVANHVPSAFGGVTSDGASPTSAVRTTPG